MSEERKAKPPRSRAFRALALCIGAAGAFLGLELTLWIVAPVPHPYASVMPQTGPNLLVYPVRWKTLPGNVLAVPTVEGTSGGEIRINQLGFRGDAIVSPVEGELRLLTLGGSTTFCAFQADGKDWPALVRSQLGASAGKPVRLMNAAYPGQLLRRHMIPATQLVPVIRPHYVIVLAGINDAVYGIDPERNPPLRQGTAGPPIAPRFKSSIKLLLGDSQIFRRIVRRRGLGRQEGLAAVTRAAMALPLETKPPKLELEAYRKELMLLCEYVKAFGARPVLITQPALYLSSLADDEVDSRCWMNSNGETRWPRAVLRRSLEAHNAVTRDVAQEQGAVLVDAAAKLDNDTSEMFDDCHFTDAGCVELADLVAAAVEAALKDSE